MRYWLIIASILFCVTAKRSLDKICRGTDMGKSFTRGSDSRRVAKLRKMYENCTYLDGNLELIQIHDHAADFSFLSNIVEITGYVRILGVHVKEIPLTNLRIIRGRTLTPIDIIEKDDPKHMSASPTDPAYISSIGYALTVMISYDVDLDRGLRVLSMPKLTEISRGDVSITDNKYLCYGADTINWDDIVAPDIKVTLSGNGYSRCKSLQDRCHHMCKNPETDTRYCWNQQFTKCQLFTRIGCQRCNNRYLRKPKVKTCDKCCNEFCAGGCFGEGPDNCYACSKSTLNGTCVKNCPEQSIYDVTTYKVVKNPKAKFTFGTLCIDKCPDYMMIQGNNCVSECQFSFVPGTQQCTKCKDGKCPKKCRIKENINSKNIDSLKDCKIIQGDLRILISTFNGDPFKMIPPMDHERLELLSNITIVTGVVFIQSDSRNFTNLRFLRNLEEIRGIGHLDINGLKITSTYLRSLDLLKLKHIRNNGVKITGNKHLCHAESINWRKIVDSDIVEVKVTNNSNASECKSCNAECTSDGCWNGGESACFECRNSNYQGRCILSCDSEKLVFSQNNTCVQCHHECFHGCNGTKQSDCLPSPFNGQLCQNVEEGGVCLPECSRDNYKDGRNHCQPCHEQCGKRGCYGPEMTYGGDGCKSCDISVLREDGNVTDIEFCLRTGSMCHKGFYLTSLKTDEAGLTKGTKVCRRCNDLCLTCTGEHMSFCDTCKYFREDRICKRNCTLEGYYTSGSSCLPCNNRCKMCTGPSAGECSVCKEYRIYNDHKDESKGFNCTATCPASMTISMTGEFIKCVNTPFNVISSVVAPSIGVFVLLLFVVLVVLYKRRANAQGQRIMKTIMGTIKRELNLTNTDEIEPLDPSTTSPDMACLRLINESELRKGAIIGSGAFGTVFKGALIPTGKGIKVPVAIKLLQDGTSSMQQSELLDEARIMCSVQHPCCIRILAVCLTAQMMLVTQLIPLGCLLDYVQKHKNHISSQVLLNWCTQIASGMHYLESKFIVHRDLAARNVLIQNPNQIKITDFGLSKMITKNSKFQGAGGKMPIKWLALECIQKRIFTHKSDVWSFGVTIWELMTYGERPYVDIPAAELPEFLIKGERLPQPSIATIDVYMLMIKCWMIDPLSRPCFHDLREEFTKMSRDPGRYLAIKGDRFLRLPSVNYNNDELIRSLSIADGPEMVLDAEDYLHPQEDMPLMTYNNAGQLKKNSDEPDGEIAEPVAVASPARRQTSQRYTEAPQVATGGTTPGAATYVKMPVDEDNYLEPNGAGATNGVEEALLPVGDKSYVELVSPDKQNIEMKQKQSNVENPEYYRISSRAQKAPLSPPCGQLDYYNEMSAL